MWQNVMNWVTNPHMVGYKLKKFALLGVKERHQAVEKKRQGKKDDFDNIYIVMKKRRHSETKVSDIEERGTDRQTDRLANRKHTRLDT